MNFKKTEQELYVYAQQPRQAKKLLNLKTNFKQIETKILKIAKKFMRINFHDFLQLYVPYKPMVGSGK